MSDSALPSITFELTGVSPLLLHNSRQFLDATCQATKELKKITSKKSKTDDDLARLADMEWLMGLYLNAEKQPIIPGENFERMLIEGARKNKNGKEATAGIIADDAVIIHNGPNEIEKMSADPRFRDKRPVVVQRARVMRCRPIFHEWTIQVRVTYIPDVVSRDNVIQSMQVAGRIIGLGDYRPKFGRFTSKVVAEETGEVSNKKAA